MKKILFVVPHLSTGGLPQYTVKMIETLIDANDVYCIEYQDITGGLFVVQRNKLINLLGERFYSLSHTTSNLTEIISNVSPDIIHFQEIPETFIPEDDLKTIYSDDRNYKIIATTHSSYTNPNLIRYGADKFILVSEWSKNKFTKVFDENICDVWEYPITKIKYDKKFAKEEIGFDKNVKHILNVGLFTPGKNQKELIDIANKMKDENVLFHFVGNQAVNFEEYWKPIMENFPKNCIWHGERDDVEKFYKAADLFYFPSNMELNPLAIKEALSYGLPTFIKKLEPYENYYDGMVTYIETDMEYNIKNIQNTIHSKDNEDTITIILSYADTPHRKKLLNDCIDSISAEKMVSTHYPVDVDVQQKCEHVLYTKDNPLLLSKDFEKYNVNYFHWWIDDNGIRQTKPFQFEHGYAVYKLIQDALRYAKSIGKSKVHIVNYDYVISDLTFKKHNVLLEDYDIVIYNQRDNAYDDISFNSAFFSARIDAVQSFFEKYKDISEYYLDGDGFNILERKLYSHYKNLSNKIHTQPIDTLKINNKLNREIMFKLSNEEKDSNTEFVLYDGFDKNKDIIRKNNDVKITNHFIEGGFIEILSTVKNKFKVEFWNGSNELEYEATESSNFWSKTSKKYFDEYRCKIYNELDELIYDEKYDANNKRVYIALDSKSLGDTIAWIPYVEEFRKKWNCHVIVSTFMNDLFESVYPDIEFVKPNTPVDGLYAMYKIGLYVNDDGFDLTRNPISPNTIPLQKVASDILGLDYVEIKPKIKKVKKHNSEKPYICIGLHSTAQAKYWNNSTGWQDLVDYVKELGYDVYLLSKEHDGFMGNSIPNGVIHIQNKTLEEIGEYLLGSAGFVGISSGLSWYAWGLDVPTILISGFTNEDLEMKSDVFRVINKNVCNGCWSNHIFDKSDWEWCPEHKGTERQFECTKTITFDMVKPHIENLLKL